MKSQTSVQFGKQEVLVQITEMSEYVSGHGERGHTNADALFRPWYLSASRRAHHRHRGVCPLAISGRHGLAQNLQFLGDLWKPPRGGGGDWFIFSQWLPLSSKIHGEPCCTNWAHLLVSMGLCRGYGGVSAQRPTVS